MTREELQKIAEEKARERGIAPALAFAMIDKESAWNPNAVSKSGAQGIMQLMPGTAKDLGVTDPFDPSENIRGGLDYLKQMQDEFKTPELALAAYNSGPGNVRKFKGIPDFAETQDYVPSVLAKAKEYGFNPGEASGTPKSQLLDPDFSALTQRDALDGDESSPVVGEPKKDNWFGKIFGATRGPETIDQYGNKKPGEFKEGIGRKILSFAAPLLFGAFPSPFMGALGGSIINSQLGSRAKARREDDDYEKLLAESMKQAQPSDDLKKFREWQKMSPEDRDAYKDLKESTNPFAAGNLDLARQRLDLEKDKQKQSLLEKEKDRDLKEKLAKTKGYGPDGKPLSADASKVVEAAHSGIQRVKEFRARLASGEANLLLPEVFDRETANLQNQLSEAIARLRSGAAISENEEKRFFSMLPSFFDSDKLKMQKLQQAEDYLRGVGKRIAPQDFENDAEASPEASGPTAKAATHRFNPATGKIEAL